MFNYEYLDYEFPIDYDENEKLILYLIIKDEFDLK
jgi:hypothetical protein